MRYLGLVLVLCGAGLVAVPGSANAFEIQDGSAAASENGAEFTGLNTFVLPEFKGSSLAMPYSNSSESSGHISDYGNSIPIPAPGIDAPAPAWAYSPNAFSRGGFR
jgi:hypothetical protein